MERRNFLTLVVAGVSTGIAGCTGDDEPPSEPDAGEWLDGVPNYDGFEDHRGEQRVEVVVGAGANGFLFEPPAVSVDAGTTVVFEWSGEGGDHEVAEVDGAWKNPGGLTSEAGHVWEREFTDPGTHRYECWPHAGQGMKGAVFVDATDE